MLSWVYLCCSAILSTVLVHHDCQIAFSADEGELALVAKYVELLSICALVVVQDEARLLDCKAFALVESRYDFIETVFGSLERNVALHVMSLIYYQ